MKIEIEYEVGDKVKLPLNEEGTIVEIKDIIWGFYHYVKITKPNKTFDTKKGQIKTYRKEDLIPNKKEVEKYFRVKK